MCEGFKLAGSNWQGVGGGGIGGGGGEWWGWGVRAGGWGGGGGTLKHFIVSEWSEA